LAASTFTAAIQIRGINPFILVSARRANAIKPGWRKPLPVPARINGKPEMAWYINMMPAGNGDFYLYLRGGVREASGTAVGDRVRVEIDFDASYRNGPQHPMLEGIGPKPSEGSPATPVRPQITRGSCQEPQPSPLCAFG
jgi:hypothetical protein